MTIPTYPLLRAANADATYWVTISAKSRSSITEPRAMAVPDAIPPSQNTSKLTRGRGREIKSATMARRVGSGATTSASASTVPHIIGGACLLVDRRRW